MTVADEPRQAAPDGGSAIGCFKGFYLKGRIYVNTKFRASNFDLVGNHLLVGWWSCRCTTPHTRVQILMPTFTDI